MAAAVAATMPSGIDGRGVPAPPSDDDIVVDDGSGAIGRRSERVGVAGAVGRRDEQRRPTRASARRRSVRGRGGLGRRCVASEVDAVGVGRSMVPVTTAGLGAGRPRPWRSGSGAGSTADGWSTVPADDAAGVRSPRGAAISSTTGRIGSMTWGAVATTGATTWPSDRRHRLLDDRHDRLLDHRRHDLLDDRHDRLSTTGATTCSTIGDDDLLDDRRHDLLDDRHDASASTTGATTCSTTGDDGDRRDLARRPAPPSARRPATARPARPPAPPSARRPAPRPARRPVPPSARPVADRRHGLLDVRSAPPSPRRAR